MAATVAVDEERAATGTVAEVVVARAVGVRAVVVRVAMVVRVVMVVRVEAQKAVVTTVMVTQEAREAEGEELREWAAAFAAAFAAQDQGR